MALFAATRHSAVDERHQLATMRALFALQPVRRLRDHELLLLHRLCALAVDVRCNVIRSCYTKLRTISAKFGMHIAYAMFIRVFALFHFTNVARAVLSRIAFATGAGRSQLRANCL